MEQREIPILKESLNQISVKPNTELPQGFIDQAPNLGHLKQKEETRKTFFRQVIAGAARRTTASTETSHPLNPSSLPVKNSFFSRVGNIVTDPQLNMISRTALESTGIVMVLALTSRLAELPFLVDLSFPAFTAYGLWRFWNLNTKSGIPLGKHMSLKAETSFLHQQTPVGPVQFGERVGALHLLSNLSQATRISPMERKVNIPLDGLIGLQGLRQKVIQQDPLVSRFNVFKAESHLVAQNPQLFEKLGFKLEPEQSGKLRSILVTLIGKAIFVPIFGFSGLFAGKGIRGFAEGNSIKTGHSRTAWITPEDLVSHESAIQTEIQHFQTIAARLEKRRGYQLRGRSEK